MSRFSFRDNVWSKWFPRFYHDHDTYRTEKLGGILERFVKICSEYFDDIMVDHTNEPGLDNIIELLDPDTTPELFMNYLWEFLGEIPYGYGLVIQNKEYNKDDITDWLRSDTYFRANSRKLLKYAISLYKIRGTQRFYQILGKFYYVRFTLIETENGGSPGDPLPLPTYDHLVISTFTQLNNQENVSYYSRGNNIQVRAGYPDGDCYSCLYYALKITVSSTEYNNWVNAGKLDVVKNTFVQIVERYLPVHCKLARYANNSFKVIWDIVPVHISDYYIGWWANGRDSLFEEFEALDGSQLAAVASNHMKSQTSITKTVEASDIIGSRQIFFIMWKEDSAPQGGIFYGGISPETLTAASFLDENVFNAQRDDVTIGSTIYHVAGLRSAFESGNYFTINF